MDLQQPSRTEPAGKEDLSSLLFESTTTLPSLSPLSADYPKEHTATIAFSADSISPEALQRYATETDYSEGKDHKYTFGLGAVKEDKVFSDRGYAVEHPTSQSGFVPADHAKLYTQSAKEMFSGMLKSVGPPHEEFSDLKEGAVEHYVDFKPFVRMPGHELGYEFKDLAADKSNISSLNFEYIKPDGKYTEEKDIDISDDISPEVISDSSSYETFAPLQKAAPLAYGGNPFTDSKSEKSMEKMETRPKFDLGSNVATVNPFLEHVDQGAEYVTTNNIVAQASNKAEGLTPDIVQEAHESEVYEVGVPKLTYEPKIDLVQTTAKASQENITPPTQNAALFGDSDSVSSPILPDIVMEAPLTSASQPDVSAAGHVGAVSEEKIKFESEKPPSYEDAINKATLKEHTPAVAHVEPVKEPQGEEADTPYISIACDLIKETIPEKVTNFSKAIKSDFDFQYTAFYDKNSTKSEPSKPSYKLWESEVISKEAATTIGSIKSYDALKKEQESDQELPEEVLTYAAPVEFVSGSFDTKMLGKTSKSDFDSQYTAHYDESSPESEPSEPSYKHWQPEVISKDAITTVGSVKSHDGLEKEQGSDQKWAERIVSKGKPEEFVSGSFDTKMLGKTPKSDFDFQYTAHYDESSPESEPSEPSYKHWESEVISKEATTTVGSVKSFDDILEKEQGDLKWAEGIVNKAGTVETLPCFLDSKMLHKESVTQLSSQDKPLQMEAFGKTVYSEEVPHITDPVHFKKLSAVQFVSKPSQGDHIEIKRQDDLVLKDEPKKSENLHSQQKAKESAKATDKLLDFSKAESEIEETISKPAPPTKDTDVASSSTKKIQPAVLPAFGSCNFKSSGN